MSDINDRKRRQHIHAALQRSLARREQVDGLADTVITLELARLRGIEDAAFRVIESRGVDVAAGADHTFVVVATVSPEGLLHLEHALLVEGAAIPTLKAAPAQVTELRLRESSRGRYEVEEGEAP